jgi:hypothetical protein
LSNILSIKLCLGLIKELCIAGKVLFVQRRKNIQALLDLGLSVSDVFEVLKNLKVEDYHQGPVEDYDGSEGQIWKFIHPLSGKQIYIKVKIVFHGEKTRSLTIISFHE